MANMGRSHVKTRNAYLVFYEWISDYEPPKSEDEAEEDVVMKHEDSHQDMPSDICEMITNYN